MKAEKVTIKESARFAATGLMLTCLCWMGQAVAAGGHHAVDDAEILDPGACEVEGWYTRAARHTGASHAGTACRVGPLELGAGAEHERSGGGSQTGYGLQAKWSHPVREDLRVGLSWSPAWQARVRPRFQGSTLSGLLTWSMNDDVSVHANLGRDFVHQGNDEPRHGAGIDWALREGWKLIAERYRQEGGHFVRAGVRWTPGKDWVADVSRTHLLRGTGLAGWTVALTRGFD